MPNMDVETFASALANNLEEVCLGEAVLSDDHLQTVFSVIGKKAKSILKLRKLVFLNYQHRSALRVCGIMNIAICRVHAAVFVQDLNHGLRLLCYTIKPDLNYF